MARALKDRSHRVSEIDLVRRLMELKPDAVFIALHGRGGEDRAVQELLEIQRILYTGSGVLAGIRAMDKILAKHIFLATSIPTPPFYAFSDSVFREMGAKDTLDLIAADLGLPMVIKLSSQGSALGIDFATDARDLPRAMMSALSFDRKVLLGKFVSGRGPAVTIVESAVPPVLPIVEARPREGTRITMSIRATCWVKPTSPCWRGSLRRKSLG